MQTPDLYGSFNNKASRIKSIQYRPATIFR